MVIKLARVTQISMARTYHLTISPRATYHNIILTLNHSQSYASGHHISLSWSLHLLNWESIKCCLMSLICSTLFIFMQEMKTAAWLYHPAPSISSVYKYWINTAALMCLEQYFPQIHVYFQWPSLVLQVKKRLQFYCHRIAIFLNSVVNCCVRGFGFFFLENCFEYLLWYVKVHHMSSKTPAF